MDFVFICSHLWHLLQVIADFVLYCSLLLNLLCGCFSPVKSAWQSEHFSEPWAEALNFSESTYASNESLFSNVLTSPCCEWHERHFCASSERALFCDSAGEAAKINKRSAVMIPVCVFFESILMKLPVFWMFAHNRHAIYYPPEDEDMYCCYGSHNSHFLPWRNNVV